MPPEINQFYLTGTAADLIQQMTDQHHELVNLLLKAREIRHNKAVEEYQAAVLYHLAHHFHQPGGEALEVGTARGYSASLIAQAIAPNILITLNPDVSEAESARRNLKRFGNVLVVYVRSTDFLTLDSFTTPETFDFIFVDGDHKHVRLDFPLFNRLRVGGCIVFHDYSPQDSARPCQVVYDALNELQDALGRSFDVLVVDDQHVGMAGFVRREGETYAAQP
jgi:predicted O-methyltransferase YrrM